MIHTTAYDTTIGSKFQVVKIIQALRDCAIRDGYIDDFDLIYTNESTPLDVWFIANSSDNQAQIPFFNHPIIIDVPGRQKKVICSDIRTIATYRNNNLNQNDPLHVKNKIELTVNKARVALNMLWYDYISKFRPEYLRDISIVPMAVYASWISESISKRFGLNALDQSKITIIAARFYYGLFSSTDTLNDEDKLKLTGQIIRTFRLPEVLVSQTINEAETISNLDSFIETIKRILDNTRLDGLDVGILINLIITSWFGSNSREIIGVAIEHPPTWISLVYSSFIEKSYRNTPISKISQRYSGSKGEESFTKTLITMLNES